MMPDEPKDNTRSYLLPVGCKDLFDVQKLEAKDVSLTASAEERVTIVATVGSLLLQTPLTEYQRGVVRTMLFQAFWLFLLTRSRLGAASKSEAQKTDKAEEDERRALQIAHCLLNAPQNCEKILEQLLT